MEEEKKVEEQVKPVEQLKTGRKHTPLITFLAAVAVIGTAFGVVGVFDLFKKPANEETVLEFKHYKIAKYEDEPYYIFKSKYDGEYDLIIKDFDYTVGDRNDEDLNDFADTYKVMSYSEYAEFCDRWDIEQKYTDMEKRYAVASDYFVGSPNVEAELAEVYENYSSVEFYYYVTASGVTADITGFAIIVPVGEDVIYFGSTSMYTEEEYQNLLEYGTTYDPGRMTVDKPIIYLYPEEETEVTVELGNANNLTVSYPRYNDGWKVLARPNGDLTDLKTSRNLYALYYEAKLENKFSVGEDGFVVAGDDVAEFLEEKLAILGLNEREAEEFIVYWLPKLEANKYNYIRFAETEEIESNTALNVYPKPDSVIRVWMTVKGLDEKIDVKEQKLETPERKGFVVVEWGGAEL